jgi:hypothetical protein
VVVVVSEDVTLSQNESVPAAVEGTVSAWYSAPVALL